MQQRHRTVRRADGLPLSLIELSLDHDRPGPRPSFLLIHGFAQTATSFTAGPLPRLLCARGGRVLIGALRGHGAERQGRARDMREHLDWDLPALLGAAQEGAEGPLVYVGHSMGGVLGYALLGRAHRLHGLWTFAAPLQLAARRLDMRLLARASLAASWLWPHGLPLPTDHLLGGLSQLLSRPDAPLPVRALQRYAALTNPALAPPEALQATLADSRPESPGVLRDMARLSSGGPPRLAGIALIDAVREAPLPVAAVVGSRDIFASRASLRALERPPQAGPRALIELPEASHVDVCLGHHLPDTVQRLWDFTFRLDSSSSIP